MRNYSGAFVGDDTVEKYEKVLENIVRYALNEQGVAGIIVFAIMDNPDGTTEETRRMLASWGGGTESIDVRGLLARIGEHIAKNMLGGI